ncbi:hypothetical protein [Blastococcus sp. SYSU D00820]
MAAAAAHDERLSSLRHGVTRPHRTSPPSRTRPVRLRPAAASASVWWARIADSGPGSPEHSLVGVNSDRFPDGTPVDMTAIRSLGRRPAGWLVDLRYRTRDGAVTGVEVSEDVADLAPPMWFAEVSHATSNIPATSLMAFRGSAFRPGSLVAPHQVAARGVRMTDRVGEIRWYTRSGLVDTVVVDPALRRRGVASVLVTVAEALRVMRGWAPVRSDGRLTDLGAAWLEAAPPAWRSRLADRTEVLPDDDEDDDGPTGVARLLR